MKSRLRLAIGVGLCSSFIPFALFLTLSIIVETAQNRPGDANEFLAVMLLDWICSLAIPFCSYFYVVESKKIAFAAIIVSLIFKVVVSGALGLFLLLWAFPFGLLILSSIALTFVTLFLTIAARDDYRIMEMINANES